MREPFHWFIDGAPDAVLRWTTASPEVSAAFRYPPPTNIASPEVATHFISDDKGIHRIAVQEIALVEESFRRIEMMQRHERKHAFFFAFRKDFMVEVHTLLICSSGPTKIRSSGDRNSCLSPIHVH